jgi:hypothetical protein
MIPTPRSCLRVAFAGLFATLTLTCADSAQPISLQLVTFGLSSPVAVTNAGDGSNRLFIVEQGGIIKIYNGTQVLPTPFLDITTTVLSGGERGLLGLTFDSSYASNGRFYVFYTSKPAGEITISRFNVSSDPNVADKDSEVVLKTQDHSQFGNHNGGQIAFGPDGCIYAGLGDGGSGGDPNGNGQNLATLLGKIIRISPIDGTPCTLVRNNPFIATANARGEIWALGLRNPFRFGFDRQTGDLLIGDVGQSQREEVDFQVAGSAGGQNYCWNAKEGSLIFNSNVSCTAGTPTDPILEYDHSAGDCAIIGGYRYRGSQLTFPQGTYFYGDDCTGRIWGATESGGIWTSKELLDTILFVSGFGEDEAGEIYVVNLGGSLYRLTNKLNATHDLGGDFLSDIAWRQTGGAVAAWLMNGSNVFQSGSFGTVPANWQLVGQRDFNHDTKYDWLWRNTTTGAVAIWLLNGLQVSQSGTIGTVAGNWTIAGTGDFDGDGKGDILWRDTTTGTVAIWLMNGLQVSQTGALGTVPGNWTIVGAADFDGDGKADILWRDGTTGSLAIWLLNGLQVSQSGSLGTVPSNWTIAATGDFNGDGRGDILWRDTTTGTIAIWLLNGLQVSQTGSLGPVPSNWVIAITGDFDGNGKSDILWRDTSAGTVAIWFMNGLQVASTAGISTVGTDWTIQGAGAD